MLRSALFVFEFVFVALLLGCSGKQHTFCDDAGCDNDGSTDDATFDDVGLNGDAGDDTAGCTTTCSSDLHQILDCSNKVLMTCPPDQGCAGGMCIPACDAAKANKSSVGCEYYAQNPPFFSGGSCFAVFVANTWGSPVKVSVDRGGTMFNVSQFGYLTQGNGQSITYTPLSNGQIPANQVGVLMLNQEGGLKCPMNTVTATQTASLIGTGKTQAFHIVTDAPVVAFDIYPYGGGSTAVASGTLLLPTSVWTDNYVGITAYPPGFGSGSWISVVAQENGTDFTIVSPAAILGGGGVMSAPANTPTKYSLNKGEIIQFQQSTMPDLSGSPIQATKPIGVWGGNHCTNLEQPACDGMHQQIPPITALGSEYAAVRYRNRLQSFDEKPPWRIMGVVDGTTLTYDPPVSLGPTSLKRGQVVEFDEGNQFVVKSQDSKHPFYFGAHMTGCFSLPGNYGSPVGCAGDPEFVNVVPPAQFLGQYVFFTDPTYPETHLVFVRAKANDNAFHDVVLDCAGNLTGWKSVGSSGKYEYTRLDLVTGNFQKVGNCDNGRHLAKSDGPFGLTVWGWGSGATKGTFFSEACSYAYAAGMSVQPINTVVVPPTPN